jgi:hypothetical protein
LSAPSPNQDVFHPPAAADVLMHIFCLVILGVLLFSLARDEEVNDNEENRKVVVNQVTDYKYDE